MSDPGAQGVAGGGPNAQETYWNQLVLTKVVSCYVRGYRDKQTVWINRIGPFKAISTSGAIGAWAVWKDYAFVWVVVVGVSQIMDAVKEFIPQTKNRRAASDFVSIIENLIIDARFEWYEIFYGKYPADEIMARWRNLAKLLLETEGQYFPDGIPDDPAQQKLAKQEASDYFRAIYGVGVSENG